MNKSVVEWLASFEQFESIWYMKRLSGNDTMLTGSHQVGPYIPKDVAFSAFPELEQKTVKNPDLLFRLHVDSHDVEQDVRIVWYNNKVSDPDPKKRRDETRVTRLGGSASPLLDTENTGALVVFIFCAFKDGRSEHCHVWVCRSPEEEDDIELLLGDVDPGRTHAWKQYANNSSKDISSVAKSDKCWLQKNQIPESWFETFPSGAEILELAFQSRSFLELGLDKRLIERRKCEYRLFLSIEEAIELPRIKEGFTTIEQFTKRALSILQRRKSRSGRSLELHVRQLFIECGLQEKRDFEHQPVIEGGKTPDFLFPSARAYEDMDYPREGLQMLAIKTTCKDRWRQILNEADRIPEKHLLTLQEGVSQSQLAEMKAAGVKLVVPEPNIDKFPKGTRGELTTVKGFVDSLK